MYQKLRQIETYYNCYTLCVVILLIQSWAVLLFYVKEIKKISAGMSFGCHHALMLTSDIYVG